MSGDTGVMDAKTIRIGAGGVINPPVRKKAGQPKPKAKEGLKKIERKAFSEAKTIPGVSVFAIFGTFLVGVLMVFVVLAQIYYNETANESIRLSTQLRDLAEQHRTLELAFESSFDIREVERIATSELGMTKPDNTQKITFSAATHDTAIVVIGDDEGTGQKFTEFLGILFDYFKS